ncbi:MAG TPA: DUF72 domain-containing protein [Candidatus Dormibacteraeota bacterium]|nr:DUF72 domain-containing protein [Candidatus Dormibacteraeota bacterium]
MAAEILVGTCNWADHENFYPAELEKGKRQRDKLSYYARFFPVVEVDTTFYGIPKPQVVDGWLERTPDDFRFNVKAYRALTRHERENGVPRPPTAEEEHDFLLALQPLRESGRLVAVHYQFPPWFTRTPENQDIVAGARERHPDDVVAVEFRHRSWFDGDAWPQTRELLQELDAVYVGVDAPQIGTATAPPVFEVTSPRLCIARFHGRNWKTWYIKNAKTTAERFDYLYPPDQLAEWVPAIKAAAEAGVPVHVLMNNNRSNYAVVNAFDMGDLLGIRLPRPPDPVLEVMRERDGRIPDWVVDAPADERSEPAPRDEQLGLDL